MSTYKINMRTSVRFFQNPQNFEANISDLTIYKNSN